MAKWSFEKLLEDIETTVDEGYAEINYEGNLYRIKINEFNITVDPETTAITLSGTVEEDGEE